MVSQHQLCVACLSAVGRFMREGPHPVVEGLWRARPPELARRALTDMVDDEIAKIRRLVPSDDPAVEPLLTAFKAGFAPVPRQPEVVKPPADPESHLNLAIGYRAMGLTDDALGEAAIALTAADRLGARAQQAAEIVFDPGNLRSGLYDTLGTLRSVLFPD